MWQFQAARRLASQGIACEEITSVPTDRYNCIAWACGDDARWWWPSGGKYWPGAKRQDQRSPTRQEFLRVFGQRNFVVTTDRSVEIGVQKVALFERNGFITHAARQLPDGRWTSKCGTDVDITHRLEQVECHEYGPVALILKRPIP